MTAADVADSAQRNGEDSRAGAKAAALEAVAKRQKRALENCILIYFCGCEGVKVWIVRRLEESRKRQKELEKYLTIFRLKWFSWCLATKRRALG